MKLPFGKNKKDSPDPAADEAMTLTQHLAELRSRIIRSVLAVAIGMMGVLAFLFCGSCVNRMTTCVNVVLIW